LDQLEPHRLADAYGCLDDLHTSLPVNAADAVKGSLRQWEAWQADSKSNGAAEDTGYAIAVLKHQGEIWRRILSGEIGAEDLLTAEHYRQAAARLIGRLRNLSVSFLKRWWYIAIILLFSVGLITWAIVAYAPSGPAAVAALIATGAGALGVSWKTVGATLGTVTSKAETPLWDAEVLQSIIVAVTITPREARMRRLSLQLQQRNREALPAMAPAAAVAPAAAAAPDA